jgi:hypothetical protein
MGVIQTRYGKRTAFLAPCLAALALQSSGWLRVETVDEYTGARDTRVILRAEEWPALRHTSHPDDYKGATLVVSCGDRVPSSEGRSMLLFAGEPLMPFGGEEQAYLELSFDGQGRREGSYFTIYDFGDMLVRQTGNRSSRHVAFLGTEKSPYYSPELLDKILSSQILTVRYRTFGRDERRTVTFRVAGLQAALSGVEGCDWTTK